MTAYYVTPFGSIIDDGLTPATAFDFASFTTWAQTASLAGDVVYMDAAGGSYASAAGLTTTRDGTAALPIKVIGVTDLNNPTTTEAEGNDRPLITVGPGAGLSFDNYWQFRNLRISGNTASWLLRMDIIGIASNLDVNNAGTGYGIYNAGIYSVIQNCRAKCVGGVAIFVTSYGTLRDCIAYESVTGVACASFAAVAGNLIYDCTTGIDVAGFGRTHCLLNTIRDCATGIAGTGAGTQNHILGNLVTSCTVGAGWTAAQDTDVWDGNNWWNNTTDVVNVTKGPAATSENPNFTDPTAGTAVGFRVQNASLRQRGLTLYTVGGVQPSIYDTGPVLPSPTTPTDLSGDHYLIDGLETVTLDGNDLPYAYRHREMTDEREPAEGVYLERNVQFDLPPDDSHYAGFDKPTVGGIIIDSTGETFVIQSVSEINQFQDYYGCMTRALVLDGTYDLDDTITLYPGVDTLDAYGSKITSHTTPSATFAGVACKIMLREGDPVDWAGQRQLLEIYDVYMAEDTGQLNHGDVLKDQSGKTYKIRSYRNREHIGELSTVEVELRNKP